jgi:hypothetical protein
MTDDASTANTDRLSMIATKVERESRFTRIVVVICTIANLTVFVFGMMKTFEALPPTLLAYLMENMDAIVTTQKGIEMSHARKNAAAARERAAEKEKEKAAPATKP